MTTLTNHKKNEILPLNEETIKSLKMKDPDGKQSSKTFLLNDRVEGDHPI